jgi:hypothetical protein
MFYDFGGKNMYWQNITLSDIAILALFVFTYPIYWFVVHKLMDEIFG